VFRIFRTLGLALGLIGGAVAAQAPEFAQQYAQRLGGAADELRRAIATLESDARASGTTRDGADIARLARLSAQQQALASATSPLGRTVAVIRDPDLAIASATFREYQPAVPTTADGLTAGLLGFLAAWGGWRILSDLGLRAARRRPRQPATVA
jgi:hypothetical protein